MISVFRGERTTDILAFALKQLRRHINTACSIRIDKMVNKQN